MEVTIYYPSLPYSNLMTVIPNQVFGLTRLEELVVSKNKLPEIPGNFVRDMASLKLLNASDNEIGEYKCV